MRIAGKLMFLFIFVTIVPIGILSLVAVQGIQDVRLMSEENARHIVEIAVENSSRSLCELGERIIRQKAEDVAREIEIYINNHPFKTIEQLQDDEVFQKIAVQRVGETGYTAVTDVDTLICRFHNNPKIADLDLHTLSDKLPDFWKIMNASYKGKPSSGYYTWQDPDGVLRDKFMYIAIADARTADGVRLSVAATTYIDEFSKPVIETRERIESAYTGIDEEFGNTVRDIRHDTIALMILFAVIVASLSFMFSLTVTGPIKKITQAARRITDGDLDTTLPMISSSDEIRELSEAMGLLVGAVKYHKRKRNIETGLKDHKPLAPEAKETGRQLINKQEGDKQNKQETQKMENNLKNSNTQGSGKEGQENQGKRETREPSGTAAGQERTASQAPAKGYTHDHSNSEKGQILELQEKILRKIDSEFERLHDRVENDIEREDK